MKNTIAITLFLITPICFGAEKNWIELSINRAIENSTLQNQIMLIDDNEQIAKNMAISLNLKQIAPPQSNQHYKISIQNQNGDLSFYFTRKYWVNTPVSNDQSNKSETSTSDDSWNSSNSNSISLHTPNPYNEIILIDMDTKQLIYLTTSSSIKVETISEEESE